MFPAAQHWCRQLYPLLKQLEALIGIWRHSKRSDKPALHVFVWGDCCAEGKSLRYDTPGQEPWPEPFQQVGPGHSASVQHVDSMHCLLTAQTSKPQSPATKAVQAATAVAVGGIPTSNRVCLLVPSLCHVKCYHAKFPCISDIHLSHALVCLD